MWLEWKSQRRTHRRCGIQLETEDVILDNADGPVSADSEPDLYIISPLKVQFVISDDDIDDVCSKSIPSHTSPTKPPSGSRASTSLPSFSIYILLYVITEMRGGLNVSPTPCRPFGWGVRFGPVALFYIRKGLPGPGDGLRVGVGIGRRKNSFR